MKETIKLFKGLPIESKKTRKGTKALHEATLRNGFIFSPEVIGNYTDDELMKIVEDLKLNLSAIELNNMFHKSWQKIKYANIRQLVMEQLLHYITTYGFEELNIYDENSVYIPNEKLDIPDIDTDLKFTVIKGLTKEELKEKVLTMINSGIALKEETIKDIVVVAKYVELLVEDVDVIKNKEVKVIMYDELNLIPESPIEFLRFIMYKTTGKTLLIKNMGLISEIKINDGKEVADLFLLYKTTYGLEKLAQIFYRYKPLFLALKVNKALKIYVNKIRKLAVKNHKPMPADYLNDITANLNKGIKIDTEVLIKELSKVNTFRKIRLAYALKFRTSD